MADSLSILISGTRLSHPSPSTSFKRILFSHFLFLSTSKPMTTFYRMNIQESRRASHAALMLSSGWENSAMPLLMNAPRLSVLLLSTSSKKDLQATLVSLIHRKYWCEYFRLYQSLHTPNPTMSKKSVATHGLSFYHDS